MRARLDQVRTLHWCWAITCRAGMNGIVKPHLKFANHGYVTLMPNLYFRAGHGTPEDVAAKVRADGGVADDHAVGDLAGAMKYLRTLPYVNGKVESSALAPEAGMPISLHAEWKALMRSSIAGADVL